MEAVEIQVERGSCVSPVPVDLTTPDEVRTHVTVVDPVDPPPTSDRPVGDAVDGWEIGALAVLLTAGAEAVSGIDERRVARVRAVLAAMEAAR